MPSPTLANPGFISILGTNGHDDFVWPETFGLGVTSDKRVLQTMALSEGGAEADHLIARDPVSWGVRVPDGAELFGATSGISSGTSRQIWVGWRSGRLIQMQAVMQEQPIDTDLVPGEKTIFPAVTDGAGVAALYTWRPVPTGTALWRRVFLGQIKTKGSVHTEALSEIPGNPLVSIAGTIPGDGSQHALIGWAEDTEEGAVLGVAIVRPDRIRVLRCQPIRNFVALPRQRPGIWAAAPVFRSPEPFKEHFELTVGLQSRSDSPTVTYSLARFSIGPEPDRGSISVEPVVLPDAQIQSAAFDYSKNQVNPRVRRTYLMSDGRLFRGEHPTLRRQGVPLDSPLPVVTTLKVYWGTTAPDGTMTFEYEIP